MTAVVQSPSGTSSSTLFVPRDSMHHNQRLFSSQHLLKVLRHKQAAWKAKEVVEGIFVGALRDARNVSSVQKLNIRHFLSLGVRPPPAVSPFLAQNLCFEDFEDHCDANILSLLPSCFTFLDRCQHLQQNVLIHCELGKSRSVSILVGYLMYRFRWSFNKALETVLSKYPTACPNFGFMQQLIFFETHLNSDPSLICLSNPSYRSLFFRMRILRFTRLHHLCRLEPSSFLTEAEEVSSLISSCVPSDILSDISCIHCSHSLGRVQSVLDSECLADGALGIVPDSDHQSQDITEIPSGVPVFPQPWMVQSASVFSLSAGPLLCPNCSGQVGSFSWDDSNKTLSPFFLSVPSPFSSPVSDPSCTSTPLPASPLLSTA